MILDKQALFSDSQAITASAASTNVIDSSTDKISFGTPVEVLTQVDIAFATLSTLTIDLQTSVDEAFTSPVTLDTTGAIPVASLVAGYRVKQKFLPKGNLGYLRKYYTVAGSNATAGKITSGICTGVQEGHHNT